VGPDADPEEIRAAFRREARRAHPDTGGDPATMAAVSEAWFVLSDPGRRALYDQSLADPSAVVSGQGTPSGTSAMAGGPGSRRPAAAAMPPARVPWRGLLAAGALAGVGVLVMYAVADPPVPPAPDRLLLAGECVTLAANGDAVPAVCDGVEDGVVVTVVGFDQACDAGTEAHRDPQGRGWACVRIGAATASP
jgi:hypothetical protein